MTQNEKPRILYIWQQSSMPFEYFVMEKQYKDYIPYVKHSAYIAIQQELEEARQQLEFYCGNKCDPHYNPCSAREYLAKYPRGNNEATR